MIASMFTTVAPLRSFSPNSALLVVIQEEEAEVESEFSNSGQLKRLAKDLASMRGIFDSAPSAFSASDFRETLQAACRCSRYTFEQSLRLAMLTGEESESGIAHATEAHRSLLHALEPSFLRMVLREDDLALGYPANVAERLSQLGRIREILRTADEVRQSCETCSSDWLWVRAVFSYVYNRLKWARREFNHEQDTLNSETLRYHAEVVGRIRRFLDRSMSSLGDLDVMARSFILTGKSLQTPLSDLENALRYEADSEFAKCISGVMDQVLVILRFSLDELEVRPALSDDLPDGYLKLVCYPANGSVGGIAAHCLNFDAVAVGSSEEYALRKLECIVSKTVQQIRSNESSPFIAPARYCQAFLEPDDAVHRSFLGLIDQPVIRYNRKIALHGS